MEKKTMVTKKVAKTEENKSKETRIADAVQFRTEMKFLLPEMQLQRIESKVRLICFKDPHTDENARYEIRSLYFDSPDDICYRECKSGADNRKKYRIRIYNGSDERINLECKMGLHGKKRKETVLLTKEEYDVIRENRFPEDGFLDEEILGLRGEFTERLQSGYLPKVVVGYQRTAYVYPAGNVRITVDRDITALPPNALFDKSIGGIPVLFPGKAVLEIKYDDVLPGAIRNIMAAEDNLRPISFSKYALCRDALKGETVGWFE